MSELSSYCDDMDDMLLTIYTQSCTNIMHSPRSFHYQYWILNVPAPPRAKERGTIRLAANAVGFPAPAISCTHKAVEEPPSGIVRELILNMRVPPAQE